MATVQKVLGQVAPAATTLTDLYTVPTAKYAVISTLVVCNRGIAGTVRVAIAVAGEADSTWQYIYHDVVIPQQESLALTIGITLAATDKVRVYASSGDFSFNLFGTEGDV